MSDALLTDRELASLRNMGNECEAAADEIVCLRAALRVHVEAWDRVHHVLAKHDKHPGRTDDHLADVIDRALAAPAPAQAEPVAAPTVIYSPVATKPQIDGRHPNDNEPVDPERWYWLSRRGDDAGQGLDPYWKWGHSAGWNDHKKHATPPAAAAPDAELLQQKFNEGRQFEHERLAAIHAQKTAAPLAQPLTEARILEMAAEAETPAWGEWYTDEDALFKFARAVEAHKGQP